MTGESDQLRRKKVLVSDDRDNQVAVYIRPPGFDHILSTYEYDEADRLVRSLPPITAHLSRKGRHFETGHQLGATAGQLQ